MDDAWIKSNSPVDAERVHAIGAAALYWNQCERGMHGLFWAVSGLSWEESWALSYDLGDVAIWTKILALSSLRDYDDTIGQAVENARAVYDVCRQNRNIIAHSRAIYPDPHQNLFKRARNALEPYSIVIQSDLSQIREIVNAMRILDGRLFLLACVIDEYRGKAPPDALFYTLPIPSVLGTPLHPAPGKAERPPRPSSASRRRMLMRPDTQT